MVRDVEPVAHLAAVAVERQPLALERVRDEERDQLLRVLVRAVGVRPARDRGVDPECPDVRRDVQVARRLGDPTDEIRGRWVALQQARGIADDFTLELPELNTFSFVLAGDTGEGDHSQYAVVPGLLNVGQGTSFMIALSDVIYPTGDINEYVDKFFRPYSGYPSPIYAVPGNHDWYDGLGGYMRHFCGCVTGFGAGRVCLGLRQSRAARSYDLQTGSAANSQDPIGSSIHRIFGSSESTPESSGISTANRATGCAGCQPAPRPRFC